jgi:hypothetical protein
MTGLNMCKYVGLILMFFSMCGLIIQLYLFNAVFGYVGTFLFGLMLFASWDINKSY